jgi:PST family polysaccharide transporter
VGVHRDDPPDLADPTSAAVRRAQAEARQRRGTRQLLAARGGFMVTSYLTSVILARTLGPAAFGAYGILLSTLVWLEMVSYLGVPGALTRLIPEHEDETERVEQSARVVLAATSILVFVAAWGLAPRLGELFRLEDGTRLFRLAILDIPVAAAYQAYNGSLMGRRRFGPQAVSQALLGATKLLGVALLVVLGMSVGRALVVNVLGSCAALAFLIVRYPPTWARPAWRLVRRIASLGAQIGVFMVALQVLISLDLWSLGSLWQGSDAELGRYVAALKIAQTLIVIPIVQAGVLMASVAWALASEDAAGARAHVLEASRFALILSVPACVVVGGSASPLMGLMFSAEYAPGGRYLVLQLVAFACFAVMDTLAHALMAAGRQRVTALVLVAFIPLVAIANGLLVPRFGPVGAAVSLLAGMAGTAATVGVLAWKEFGPPFAAGTLARVAGAALVVAVPTLLWTAAGAWVLVKICLLGAAYLLVLWLLGEIGADDFALPGRGAPGEESAVTAPETP